MLDNRTALRVNSGFAPYAEGWWAWGSSVLHVPDDGEGGLFHMLVSVYPSQYDFFRTWLTRAQVVHAVAPSPYGPFNLTGVALGYGGEDDWDRSLMNPKFLRSPSDGTYLLFYTGDTYPGPWPSPSDPVPVNPNIPQSNQRVGVAYSSTPGGPYTRLGSPILEPRPGQWDSRMVTNPAVTLMPNGSFLMVYKASNPPGPNTTQSQVCLGVATAPTWRGPWTRPRSDPILPCPPQSFDFEDPCVWYDRTTGFYHLVVKDFEGKATGAGYSGAHAISKDGLEWSFTTPALAYTTTHVWDDGKVRKQHYQERPQVLLNETTGTPIGMYYATDTALNGSVGTLFWNMFQPLQAI
jgi:hypothetical protein